MRINGNIFTLESKQMNWQQNHPDIGARYSSALGEEKQSGVTALDNGKEKIKTNLRLEAKR